MRARARRERALLRDRRRFHGELNVWPHDPRHLYTLLGSARPVPPELLTVSGWDLYLSALYSGDLVPRVRVEPVGADLPSFRDMLGLPDSPWDFVRGALGEAPDAAHR